MKPLPENEKKILSLLSSRSSASKQEIVEICGMGWATAVKMVNRLVSKGFICESGSRRVGRKGKETLLYGLKDDFPLVIGVDVEYNVTELLLTNLSGDILARRRCATPQPLDCVALSRFLEGSLMDFIFSELPNREKLFGIGIGIPGIGISYWGKSDWRGNADRLAGLLESKFKTTCRIEINTRAYSVYERWKSSEGYSDDFFFVSVRTGVGAGIFRNGVLYQGINGLSGAIGHIIVEPEGILCRCGKRGCLETVVNQNYLVERYRKVCAHKRGENSAMASGEEGMKGLLSLFADLANQKKEAVSIISEAAEYLGYGIACLVNILDINSIIIAGNWGADGKHFANYLLPVVKKHVFPGLPVSLQCLPFDEEGHVKGAALLIFKDIIG